LDAVAGLLGVRVEAGLEVMDDREEGPLLGGGDVDLPTLLFQAVLGVVDLLRLARVPGEQQDLEHGGDPWLARRLGRRSAAGSVQANGPGAGPQPSPTLDRGRTTGLE